MPEERGKIEGYVAQVCEQIRWKRAKEGLAMELRTHLLDQKDACLAEGMSEEEAQAESVRQMGDPVEVGTQLDRVHRPKPQWDLMLLVLGLVLVGLVIQGMLMTQLPLNLYIGDVYSSQWVFVERAIFWSVLGGILMLAIYWLDYTVLGRRATLLCALWVVAVAASMPFAHRHGGRLYEPQYLLMLAPVCLALLVYGMRGKGWLGLLICGAGIGVFAAEALLLPSVTVMLLVVCSGAVLLLTSVWRGWLAVPKWTATGLILGLPLVPMLLTLINSAYLTERLNVAIHPELDPLGKGYLPIALRKLLQGAKWVGQGESIPWEIPDLNTDLFLTRVIHHLGWAAGLAMITALILLLAVAFFRCFRQKGMLGLLLSLAVVLTLGAETLTYVINNLGLWVFASMSLPFLSYGGRYMVINLALMGLLMSVFREERLPQAQKRAVPDLHRKWISLREDGAVIILPPWVKPDALSE